MNAMLVVTLGLSVFGMVASCSEEGDEQPTGAVSTLGAGQPSGNGGDVAFGGRPGVQPAGGEGGVLTSPTPWACGSAYALDSYDGDMGGLCDANESRWQECCQEGGGDVPAALRTRCAPDGSACLSDSYCTLYTETYECGWIECDPDNPETGSDACPWAKAAQALAEAEEGRGLVPCAEDSHCAAMQMVCNVRLGERMFCGLAVP